MSNNVRFRGRCVVTDEWVYGDLIHIMDGTLIYKCDSSETEVAGDEMPDDIVLQFYAGEIAVVDPDSVEQVSF